MIIELVGLPGSGKTTFARSLTAGDRFSRVRIENKLELVWYNLLFFFRFPGTFFRLLLLHIKYRGPRSLWHTKFTSIFLDYNAKYMKARRVPFAVLDQGHLQVLMSLFENELPEHEFNKVLRILPKSDHYIFFNIPEAIRLEHLADRGYQSRHGLMTDDLRRQWQQTATKHFDSVFSNCSQLAPATIDTVTPETDLSAWTDNYQKTNFIRYVTFARLPTEKAHGLQIVTMCDEFTKLGNFISLITPKRSNPIKEGISSYYEPENELQIRYLKVPDVIGSFTKVQPIHHYLHEILFTVWVFFIHLPKGVIVYTRTPLVAKVCAWRGRRVVIEMHFWPQKGKKITAWLLKGSSVIANSDGTKQDAENYGLKAMLAHNGFPKEWLEIDVSKEEAKERLGIDTQIPVVMYVGTLDKWKGVDTLCEAAKLLSNKVKVVIIGGEGDRVAKWQDKYPEVSFLGSRPYRDLGYNQRAADILVVPNDPIGESEKYTSPIKLFAHLASGRPVIVSDLSTMRAVVDENSVWFSQPGDPNSLVKTIKILIYDTEQSINEKIKVAINLAEKYTWQKRSEKIIKGIT